MKEVQENVTVTVGIPTYNRRLYVLEAIRSCLCQTYKHLEVIVCDNASTDDTWEHITGISDPRLKCIRQPRNCGMVGNFNSVLRAATGQLFLLLSDDDLLEPNAIEMLSLPFRQKLLNVEPSSLGVVWCPCKIIDAAGKVLWHTATGPAVESSVALIENLWSGRRGPRLASVLIRTADARRVGGYDEERFGALCDTGNWGQVALLYSHAACVHSPVVRYRVHPSTGTGTALCEQWQRWGDSLLTTLVESVRRRGQEREAARIERLRKPLLANLTVDVMMRGVGTSGWIRRSLAEVWRSRKYLITPYAGRQLAKDGFKLVRQLSIGTRELQQKALNRESTVETAAQRNRSNSMAGRGLATFFPPGQVLRYLLVGGFNTAFGYTTFAVINFALRRDKVPASYIFALAISTLINVTVAHLGYKLFVFKTRGNYLREWSAAMAVSWSAFLPAVILLPIFVRLFSLIIPGSATVLGRTMDRNELAPYVANAFLTCVAIIYTFIGHRFVTFRRPKDGGSAQTSICAEREMMR